MPLLYYWRGDNYRRDLDMGAGYHLNQGNPLLHQTELGDSLWAFTKTLDGRYTLAAELVVKAKTLNPPKYRYGRYRIWGDINRSKYFVTDNQPNIESIIRSLSCRASALHLGQSFQGHSAVRQISMADHQILSAYASDLLIEPRARILPEEKLEAMLFMGDRDAVQRFIIQEDAGAAAYRKEYLYGQAVVRSRQLIQEVQHLYGGRCQLCEWNPTDRYGQFLCQGHHIQWLSRGGQDSFTNLVLLCPNHHTAVHRCDAPLDYQSFSFDFGFHKEYLRLIDHQITTS